MDVVLDGHTLVRFQVRALSTPGWPAPRTEDGDGLWYWIEENHRCNTLLWAEEDQARRQDVPAAEIARNKRNIDRYNQRRNDAVEAIDERLLRNARPPAPDAWLNSETAGSIIDRLSIAALKVHHMRAQTLRTDVDQAHRDACRRRLARLREQQRDLRHCLDVLLRGLRDGHCSFKVYRQFKMYNDPALNPCLGGSGTRAA